MRVPRITTAMPRRSRRAYGVSVGVVAAMLAGHMVVGASGAGAAEPLFPYPVFPFDFATSHGDFGPGRGHAGIVPSLVVYGTFTDQPESVQGVSAASLRTDIFPVATRGTVADYFSYTSNGNIRLIAAEESQGAPNDGVVQVSLGKYADFEALFKNTGNFETQGQAVVRATANFVDYRKFDKNGDGKITPDELVIVSIKTSVPNAGPDNCGIAGGIAAGTVLNGMNLSTNRWVNVTTATNRMTIAHEIAHSLLGAKDHSYTAGRLDIMGITCGGPRNSFDLSGPGLGGRYPNAYNRLHWGWGQPTVIDRDGYYNVGRNSSGNGSGGYLLYDPARGTSDYFLVEARPFAMYDGNASDSGVVIWQVDDTRFGTARGPTELIRPTDSRPTPANYTGSNTDAWDPLDPRTSSQRTMTGTWRDGNPAKVAVRAIHNQAGGVPRVWFDVRGPGILVDGWQVVDSALVGQTTAITFPVMNTGEQADTFEFRLADNTLPAGWTQVPQTRVLAAGESGTASVTMRIPPATPIGSYRVAAAGKSTTGVAASSDPITIRVDPVADVSVTKSAAPNPVPNGEALDYTLTVRNNGPSPATGVTLTDALPATVTYVSASASQGTCSPQDPGAVSCSVGPLAVNASATATIRVIPNAVGTILNATSAQAREADLNTNNNNATTSTAVVPSADLSLAQTTSLNPVIVGETLAYTLVVENNGPDAATDTMLTDTLPPGVSYTSATSSQGTCSFASGTVTCPLDSVPAGATATATIEVIPRAKGTIANAAAVKSSVFDRDPSNNSAATSTDVVALIGGAFGERAQVKTSLVSWLLGPLPSSVVSSGPLPSVNLPPGGGGPITAALAGMPLGSTLDAGVFRVSTEGGRAGSNVLVTSSADAANVKILGAVVAAEGVHSDCRADLQGAQAQSRIARLTVLGLPVTVPAAPNTTVNLLGIGVLTINEQVHDGFRIVAVNALHLRLNGIGATGDVVVSHSRCGIEP